MDRRQRKSREAIFSAFANLLSKKEFNEITVGEIIEKADIARATFYSHFETKEYLLKELLEELFCHIFDKNNHKNNEHRHIFDCNAPDSVFLHLFQHFQRNDNNIVDLLSSKNNDLFLSYFKSNLKVMIQSELDLFKSRKNEKLPDDFWLNHITSTFVETLRWWIENGMSEPPELITEYFYLSV